MRRPPNVPPQYVAALLLAALIGGGIYALRRSAVTPHIAAPAMASAGHSPTVVHHSPALTTTSAARPNGEASKPAGQILADAASALRSVSGFELQGAVRQGSRIMQMRLLTNGRQSLDMEAAIGAEAYEILSVPAGVYVRGTASFWAHSIGTRGALLAGRWIRGSRSALASDIGHFKPETLARCLTEGHGALSIAGTTSINGQPAVVLRDAGNLPGTTPGTLAVATTGPPYPLRLNATGPGRAGGRADACNDGHADATSGGTLFFSHFNQVPRLEPPADALETPGPPVA